MAFLTKLLGAIIVGVLPLILCTLWYGYNYFPVYAKGHEDIELRLVRGLVYVQDGDWRQVTKNTTLKPGQSIWIKDGSATLAFFGSTLLKLDANTEVNIVTVNQAEAKVIIKLENGRAWNRVIKATTKTESGNWNTKGLRENEVPMPTAVATVRGSAFSTDAKGSMSGIEGKIGIFADGRQVLVDNATAVMDKTITLRPLNDKNPWLLKNRRQDNEFDADLAVRMGENIDRWRRWPSSDRAIST